MAVSRNRLSPDPLPDLPGRVRAGLIAAGVGPGGRLCVALSGGVDSVVLLHLLHQIRPGLGFQLSAVHVHHGLSPNADHWQAVCAAHCARLGVPFEALRVAVARDHPQGLEAAARLARYAALDAQPVDWLVLAHHLDDQAETLIFRLLRGSGLRGAGAMRAAERPVQGLPRLRPLLGSRRREIEAWARGQGLAWVEDESNADPRYTRNRLRRDLLPAWEADFPGAVPALARAAGHFQEASDLLDELAAQDAAGCGGGDWSLHAFAALSEARQGNLLRWAVRRRGSPPPEAARLAEALRQLREAGPAAALRLPLGEWALGVFRGRVWLEPREAAAPQSVAVGFAAEGRIGVAADLAAPRGMNSPLESGRSVPWGAGRVVFEVAEGEGLDLARLAGADALLTVPWPGLRLRQGADRPRRSFKNLCQEAGLPAWWRAGLPVLRVAGEGVGEGVGEVAWIGGIGVAAEFACRPGELGVVARWEAGAG
jgi:tRNA(Ile)-lysidine synthase